MSIYILESTLFALLTTLNNMNEKQQIASFIKHVVDNNYSAANSTLQTVINEKLKNRIKKADAVLANKNTKKS